MTVKSFRVVLFVWIVLLLGSSVGLAQRPRPLPLPEPQTDGGKPLMQALKERKSSRAFSGEKLSTQTLSNMLWAAFGVNRPDSGKRTAPSAVNWREIDIYVAMEEGLFLYDAEAHTLVPVVAQDLRALTGVQPFVKDAPVNLVYVGDFSKVEEVSDEDRIFFCAADAGFIGQNVYLFCASEGLATVVRAMIKKPELAKAMNLRPDQEIVLAQTVGYPRK
ncbi:SagB/ThcOx family dehydrogenase [Candidatus Sumerlaeota bacterium]|nr:SagB/ThcOx family dehydrogenase [Candidatus Sumerlaeota bacterium]